MIKKVSLCVVVLLAGIALFLSLPSNYYLRQALVHLHPTIDQYPIFDNRIVEAGAPIPWPTSPQYNTLSLPESYRAAFERYETVAFVVIKEGKLLFEEYAKEFSSSSHSNSFSMAKSIVSLAIGCAIDEGLIRDVDQPVSDFFPEFTGYNGKVLTLRHLLTMSAGVDFQEAYTSPFSPTTQLYYGNDLKKVTFAMQEIAEPGVYFEYQSGVTQLLTFIVEKATGESISHYVSRKLWTPMNAEEDALWSLDKPEGIEKAYCCFNSNARDFARFGQLMLTGGRWNDRQIISEAYIKEALTPDTSLVNKEHNDTNKAYGFQFWHLTYEGLSIPYMRGILGQYVFAIPEHNAVVVRLGKKREETRTAQYYPADIDIWLSAGLSILRASEKSSTL